MLDMTQRDGGCQCNRWVDSVYRLRR